MRSAAKGSPHFAGAVPMGDVWLSWAMDAAKCAKGLHELAAVLVERHPQLAAVLTLTDVELVVRYPEACRPRL